MIWRNFSPTFIYLYVLIPFFPEMKELSEHGISLPPNMQGLADEQIEDLKLVDEWAEKCQPSGGTVECTDDCGRRNGKGKYYTKLEQHGLKKS